MSKKSKSIVFDSDLCELLEHVADSKEITFNDLVIAAVKAHYENDLQEMEDAREFTRDW